jgi:hypothetical protein
VAAVRLFIEKFGRVVLIDEDHPLAVAQRAKNAVAPKAPAIATTEPVASAVVVNEQKVIVPAEPPIAEKPTRKRGRAG